MFEERQQAVDHQILSGSTVRSPILIRRRDWLYQNIEGDFEEVVSERRINFGRRCRSSLSALVGSAFLFECHVQKRCEQIRRQTRYGVCVGVWIARREGEQVCKRCISELCIFFAQG